MPCILHMDSLRGTHSGLKDLMQRYIITYVLFAYVSLSQSVRACGVLFQYPNQHTKVKHENSESCITLPV